MAQSPFLKIDNIGNSYMGTAYMTPRYGKYAGQKLEMFHIQDLSINYNTQVLERRTLNNRVKQKKVTGLGYTFSGNLFQCSTKMQEIIAEFEANGTQPIFDFDLTNNWVQDGLTQQRFKLTGCILEAGLLFSLNVQSDDEAQAFSGSAQGFAVMESTEEPDVEWV